MALRKGLGFILWLFWIPHLLRNSIELIPTNQHLILMEGLHVMFSLASGATRREGALSQIRLLWLSDYYWRAPSPEY